MSDVIIDQPQHTYPPEYARGKHWALDVAWDGLDLIRPGLIADDVRALLAGFFFAAITTAAAEHGRYKFKSDPPPIDDDPNSRLVEGRGGVG